jgi:hypothetical protein
VIHTRIAKRIRFSEHFCRFTPVSLPYLRDSVAANNTRRTQDLTKHCAARYLQATLMSTSRDTRSCISSGTSIMPPGPIGRRGIVMGGCVRSCSRPFPFVDVSIDRCPLVVGGGGVDGLLGGVVGNGRVRRRSAREYWCVIK